MHSRGVKNGGTSPIQGRAPLGDAAKRQARLPKAPLSAPNLMKLTEGLALGFPDRVFGTETGKKSAQWMADQMKAIGLEPVDGESFFQRFDWNIAGTKTPGFNVAGLMRGTDPKLADEYVIVTAHHDSQPDTRVGANDNATGCAGVLAIAQALAKDPPKRSVIFMTFDGEEGMRVEGKYQPGRRGSKHYAKSPLVPLSKTALLLNMDMIGQVHLEAGPRSQIHQWASRDSFAQQVLGRASKATLQPGEQAISGYPEQHDQAQMFSTDAEPLYRLGVPTVNFLSGRDLDNHAPEDDMSRIIPERIEQYAKLAHQCVVEAANHPETLSQMGITPGGLMPAYSMIRAAKGAGTKVHEEEQLRLDDLVTRMPRFKAAAADLVARIDADPKIAEAAGLDLPALAKAHGGLAKEPVLHEVRSLHAELAGELRGVDKNDLAARKPLQARLQAVQGVEDVLAGAIYVGKIEKTGNYYMQQVPAALANLQRGANRLGLEAKLEGVVFDKDVAAFAPAVSADRAVQVAKETLSGLGREVGIAAFALADPEAAAGDERPVAHEDLTTLREDLLAAAKATLGAEAANPKACVPVVLEAALHAQLTGVKGSASKWVHNFTAKNAFTDFDGLVRALKLPEADAERLRNKAGRMMVEPSPQAVVDFYADLTGLALGEAHQIRDLEELRALSKPGALDTRLEAAKADAAGARQAALLEQASVEDAALGDKRPLIGLLTASLELSSTFKKDGGLPNDVRLSDVKQKLDAVVEAAAATPGAEAIEAELSSWSEWLSPFLGLEGRAKEQARLRTRAAQGGLSAVREAWPEIAAALAEAEPKLARDLDTKSAGKSHANLAEAHDLKAIAAEPKSSLARTVGRVALIARIEGALKRLTAQASPEAEATLQKNLEAYEDLAGARAARALKKTISQLGELRALDDVQMGRQTRGGPLSVVALRALNGKDNG